MAEDKETPEQDQEEYQYATGEEFAEEFSGGEEYEPPAESAFTPPSGGAGRRFLVPGIIVVVAIGVYFFMNYTSTPPTEADTVATGPTSIDEKLAPAKPEPPVEQAAVEPPATPAPTPVVTQEITPPVPTQEAFEAEQKALAAIQEKSTQDQAALNELQSTINELQARVGDLGKAIISISDKMETIEEKASRPVLKSKGRAARRERAVRRVPPMVYEVKSVVPGRAWIQSGTGEFLSIGLGETLPGYGKVENINPATGEVKLSSGAVIKYGYYDR